MITKDWLREAASAISMKCSDEREVTLSSDDVLGILKRYCPLQLDMAYMPLDPKKIVLTAEEQDEFYRFMQNEYLNPNLWPNLRKLILRVDQARKSVA